jgi:phage N-6-adenine-methyltransferase
MAEGNLTAALRGEIREFKPDLGLKTIAVSEAAEKHFARAKDTHNLFGAIAQKIAAQADYVVWRDSVVVPSREKGKQRKPDGVAELRPHNLPAGDPGKDIAYRWRKAYCTKDATGTTVADSSKIIRAAEEATQEALRQIGHNSAKPKKAATVADPAKIERATEDAQQKSLHIVERTAKRRSDLQTGEMEWYTPALYIEKARRVLGEIDLDPASCAVAQQVVNAASFYTVEDDGLKQKWYGRVWLNPPYAGALVSEFAEKMVASWKAGDLVAAFMLTNSYTEVSWWHALAAASDAVCFTRGRIKFESPHGDKCAPTNGQSFFYFGAELDRLRQEFSDVGMIMVKLP